MSRPVAMAPNHGSMLTLFPALEPRWKLRAGALSGGEQQMLAMARALIQRPKVLLVDELSMGLAPIIVERLFDAIRRVASDDGCAVVFVEQYVGLALKVADSVSVLNHGGVVLSGAARKIAEQPEHARARLSRIDASDRRDSAERRRGHTTPSPPRSDAVAHDGLSPKDLERAGHRPGHRR